MEGLFQCILRQTFRDAELLFIDDGSSDHSGAAIRDLCSRYGINEYSGDPAETDGFCYRLIEEDNQGQGLARNAGIRQAGGKYLIFIDQDDHFDKDYFETLVRKAEATAADVVLTGYREVYPDGKVKNEVHLTNAEWCRFMNITPWGKIYQRAFLLEHDIKYDSLQLGEDIYFNLQVYSESQRVQYLDYVGYDWVVNPSSFSRTAQRSLKNQITLFPLFEALTKLDTFQMWRKDEQYEYFLLKTCIYHLLLTARHSSKKDVRSYRDQLFSWLEKYFPGFETNPLIRPWKPKGELWKVRLAVWGYMKLYRHNLDYLLLGRI